MLCSFKSETICEFSSQFTWFSLETQLTNEFKKSYNFEYDMDFICCYNGNDNLLRIYFIRQSMSYRPCNIFSTFCPQKGLP